MVLWRLRPFFSLPAAYSVQGPYPPTMEYASHAWESSTHTELLNKVELKPFCVIDSPSLTDCLQPLTLSSNVAFLALLSSC